MKHYSKSGINCRISESCSFEDGELKRDDITLIWYNDKIIGWYYGGYDYEITESYVNDYLEYGVN